MKVGVTEGGKKRRMGGSEGKGSSRRKWEVRVRERSPIYYSYHV